MVQWWLLAIPHYLVLSVILGHRTLELRSGTVVVRGGSGLISLLVLFAAVALLFTGRYPAGLFDLGLGSDRWVLRMIAYIALLTDRYPPLRLDLGGEAEVRLPPDTSPAARPAVGSTQ